MRCGIFRVSARAWVHRRMPRDATFRPRGAFTLVELLAASTLTALVMVAVLGIIGGLSARQRELAQYDSNAAWKSRFRQQLQWDLANARAIQILPNAFVLTGFASRDLNSGMATHKATKIVYWCKAVAGHDCLVRTETSLEDPAADDQEEYVCDQVANLVVHLPAADATELDARVGQPVPESLSISFFSRGGALTVKDTWRLR